MVRKLCKKLPRKPTQGIVKEKRVRFNDEGNVVFVDLILENDKVFRIFPPFGQVYTEDEWNNLEIGNGNKFSDIKEGCTVRFIYYISTKGTPVISCKDLGSLEIIEKRLST